MAINIERSSLLTVLGIIALIGITFLAANVVVKISAKYALGAAVGITLFIVSFLNTQAALYILIFSMLLSPEFGSRTTTGSGATIRFDDFFLVVIGFTWLDGMFPMVSHHVTRPEHQGRFVNNLEQTRHRSNGLLVHGV